MDPATDALALIQDSSLFDATWYRRHYGDVDLLGMDPAEHYLRFGARMGRDPGPRFSTCFHRDTRGEATAETENPLIDHLCRPAPPDPKRVLWAAARLVVRNGGPTNRARAIALAEAALPTDLRPTCHLLRANAVLAEGREDSAVPPAKRWVDHLNAYLSHRGSAPLVLRPTAVGLDPARLFDRLACAPLAPVPDGPRISVLLAACNAAATVETAVSSILGQTWRNLELIAVDDASDDDTHARLVLMAARDPRMRVLRNRVNVGPYVSKNIALGQAKGAWITGHDADEWAHPERLARHMAAALAEGMPPVSSVAMLRMTPEGVFSQIRRIGGACIDGVLQECPVSPLFARKFLTGTLGSWDCARFGADKEMMTRAGLAIGAPPPVLPQASVISLDLVGSLTNNPVFGIHPDFGVAPQRQAYRRAWRRWHAGHSVGSANTFCAFPPTRTRFARPEAADVPVANIRANLAGSDKS